MPYDPQQFDPQNPAGCPVCDSDLYYNGPDPGKRPLYKCKNQQCPAAGGRGWAYWDRSTQGGFQQRGNGQSPPQQQVRPQAAPGRPAAQAPPPRPRIDRDEFVLTTHDLAEALLVNLQKLCETLKIEVGGGVLVEQVMTTVRQFWIGAEKGLIQASPDAALPAEIPLAQRYRDHIAAAADFVAVARLAMAIGGDTALTGDEKQALGDLARERSQALEPDGGMLNN